MNSTKTSKKLLFSGIISLILFVFLEVISFTGGKVLQSKWGMWTVPQKLENRDELLSYDEYMRRRDPVVGWPFPMEVGDGLDVNGAQRNPFFPDGGKKNEPCLSLYGDSFTRGGDTSSMENNWGNSLSNHLGCYVANFAVGGYGTDQAYLRFVVNKSDPAPVTLFGFHTGDTLRNLTRIRDLENYSKSYALKPRYILDENNKLILVPIPKLSEDEYLRIISERGEPLLLKHENLQPNGPAGVIKLEFPFTVSVIRNVLNFYGLHARLAREPEWLRFLQPGHPLQGLEIIVALTRDFVALAEKRGKDSMALILPHPGDFEYFHKTATWPYRHVVDGYLKEKIPFADFGPHLLTTAKEEGRLIESYFGHTGHYNDDGNAILAKFVQGLLEHGLLEQKQPRTITIPAEVK